MPISALTDQGFPNAAGQGYGRVVTVRPVDPNRGIDGGPQTLRPTEPGSRGVPADDRRAGAGRGAEPAVSGTAYQRNADGDSATLASRMDDLTAEEQRAVEKLKARDREVRQHEQAHVAAAGSLFRGGPYYEYQTGPDGQRYAVGGRVSIDTSPGRTPEETVQKAARIRSAALAPAEPSSTDQRVAAQAAQMEAQARAEMGRDGGASDRGSGVDAVGEPDAARGLNTPAVARSGEPFASAFGERGESGENRENRRPSLDLVA